MHLQQDNYQKLERMQYLDLNVKIQKSLILDFDLPSAQDSALEDWKIDVEREQIELMGEGDPTVPPFDRQAAKMRE